MPTLIGIRTRLWAWFQPKIDRAYYTNGGLGDELMLTAIAATARATGKPIHLIASYPGIWRKNSDPASIQSNLERWLYACRRGWIKTKVIHLVYKTGAPSHIAEQMAAHTSVTLPSDWRPTVPFRQPANKYPQRIVFHNSCRGALYAASTKEWPQDRWKTLIKRMASDFEFIQIGTLADPQLPLVVDRRGKTSLSEAAEMIASAQLFLGLESGLMHVAAAVRTPSVIIVGGRSRPNETCYPYNLNITRTPSCVGCGLNDGCPHNLVCLDIPVEEVETAIRHLAAGKSDKT